MPFMVIFSRGVAAAGAIPVILAAATDDGVLAHRMVVLVGRAARGSRFREQCGSGSAHDRQRFNRLPLHHADVGQNAVMAAQAKENDGVGVVGADRRRRQRDGIGWPRRHR